MTKLCQIGKSSPNKNITFLKSFMNFDSLVSKMELFCCVFQNVPQYMMENRTSDKSNSRSVAVPCLLLARNNRMSSLKCCPDDAPKWVMAPSRCRVSSSPKWQTHPKLSARTQARLRLDWLCISHMIWLCSRDIRRGWLHLSHFRLYSKYCGGLQMAHFLTIIITHASVH